MTYVKSKSYQILKSYFFAPKSSKFKKYEIRIAYAHLRLAAAFGPLNKTVISHGKKNVTKRTFGKITGQKSGFAYNYKKMRNNFIKSRN